MNLRAIAAIAILYVAFQGLPTIDLPSLPTPQPPSVEEPTVEMQRVVAGVAAICEDMDAFDRMVWMATWEDAASIIAGENDDVSVQFENTMGVRIFINNVFDVAWKRLAKASGKYRGLDGAVEQAFSDAIGNEVIPVTDDMVDDIVELCEALAWAGARGE